GQHRGGLLQRGQVCGRHQHRGRPPAVDHRDARSGAFDPQHEVREPGPDDPKRVALHGSQGTAGGWPSCFNSVTSCEARHGFAVCGPPRTTIGFVRAFTSRYGVGDDLPLPQDGAGGFAGVSCWPCTAARPGTGVPWLASRPQGGRVSDQREPAHGQREPKGRTIPEATVARLAVYLRVLTALGEQSTRTVSSEELAAAAGVNSAKLRKDLSYLGSYGTRGVGYDVERLVEHISRALGLLQHRSVVLVGIGNLGHALAGYA